MKENKNLKDYAKEGFDLLKTLKDIKRIENKVRDLSFEQILEMFNVEKYETIVDNTYNTNSHRTRNKFTFNGINYVATLEEMIYTNKEYDVNERDISIMDIITILNDDFSVNKKLDINYWELKELVLQDFYEENKNKPYYYIGMVVYDDNNKPIGYIKDDTAQGSVVKNEEAYKTSLDKICYVSEYCYNINEGCAKQDFLDLVDGDEGKADILFDMVDWQHPSSLVDELEFDDFEEENQMRKVIIGCLEDNGFIIGEDKENNSLELENWTNGGVNMLISIEDKNDISSGLDEYLENFDIDEEIDLHREDKRYRDNFTIRQSVEDFEDWVEKVKEVKEKIEELERN